MADSTRGPRVQRGVDSTPTPILEVTNLSVSYEIGGARKKERRSLLAVDDVSLSLCKGEILGAVGESGSGKSSLARCIAGAIEASSGTIRIDGLELGPRRTSSDARKVQMVFQDARSALNPRMRVGAMLRELLLAHRLENRDNVNSRCRELMELVQLTGDVLEAYPGDLSGGQRQRVALARALAVEPDVLVADEPTSALDVSVQASVLELLRELRSRLGLSILFITHDLSIARYLCDRVAVMYLGRIVEVGRGENIFSAPLHPFTQMLVNSVPTLGGENLIRGHNAEEERTIQPGPTSGCSFYSRCPIRIEACKGAVPLLEELPGKSHRAACHVNAPKQT